MTAIPLWFARSVRRPLRCRSRHSRGINGPRRTGHRTPRSSCGPSMRPGSSSPSRSRRARSNACAPSRRSRSIRTTARCWRRSCCIAGVRRADLLVSLLHDKIDRDVIAANPKLRAIVSMAIVPSDIDVAEATARRIPVTGDSADRRRGHRRHLFRPDHRGGAPHDRRRPHGARRRLSGRPIQSPRRRLRLRQDARPRRRRRAHRQGGGATCAGFGMRVLYWGPRRRPEAEEREAGITYVPFDELLAESDFVSLHSPLTAQTRHQIGARELGLMKRTRLSHQHGARPGRRRGGAGARAAGEPSRAPGSTSSSRSPRLARTLTHGERGADAPPRQRRR